MHVAPAETINPVTAPNLLRCPHCRNQLGIIITSKRLQIGNVQFTDFIKFSCTHCSYRVRWHPVDETKNVG